MNSTMSASMFDGDFGTPPPSQIASAVDEDGQSPGHRMQQLQLGGEPSDMSGKMQSALMLVTTPIQLRNMTKKGVLKIGKWSVHATREELKFLCDTGDYGVILSGRNKIHAINCKYVLPATNNQPPHARVTLNHGFIVGIDEARCLGYSISKSRCCLLKYKTPNKRLPVYQVLRPPGQARAAESDDEQQPMQRPEVRPMSQLTPVPIPPLQLNVPGLGPRTLSLVAPKVDMQLPMLPVYKRTYYKKETSALEDLLQGSSRLEHYRYIFPHTTRATSTTAPIVAALCDSPTRRS